MSVAALRDGRRSPIRACLTSVEYPPDSGGAGRACARLAHFLRDEGMDVHVFAPSGGGATTERVDGVTLYRIPDALDPKGPLAGAIAERDATLRFDIFHGFFFHLAHPCLQVAAAGGRPVVASFRGIDAVWLRDQLSATDLAVLERAAWITGVSRDSLTVADAFVDISARSSFIPNSVDVDAYPEWRPTPENAGVVGTVCTFRAKKGVPLLLQAYGRTPRRLRRKLVLVGDYKDGKQQMRRLVDAVVARHGLEGQVEITGHVEHARVVGHLLGMRVFVLSSFHEGLPNALLEAAAVGVPIVATRVDGVKDVFTETDALLVPPADPAAMMAAIERLLADEGLARELSAAGRRVARGLSPERERRAWLDVYRRFVAW